MFRISFAKAAARAAAVSAMLVLVLVLGSFASPVAAARDRTPPTTPTNLRVTGATPYSVSLAWNPSSDNSGSFRYVICCAGTNMAVVGQTAISFTFTAGVEASRPFSFRIYAVDAAGNASRYSNSVSGTTPADATPPSKPAVSVTDVGPTSVSLAWSSVEEGPVWFGIYRDGVPVSYGGRATAGTISLLQPSTTYVFTVQARDFAGNLSPLSDPLTVTTDPVNPDDVTPPTAPGNLSEDHWGDGEVRLRWTQSTDDFDPQSLLGYDVYVNGVFDHSLVAAGTTIVYGVPGLNTFTVIAVDTAGNRSALATITVNLDI